MKYAFIGSHGTGKSAATHFLASKLKKENPSKTIKVLEESVREITKLVGINNQEFQKLAILNSLYDQVLYSSLYDIVICDRIPYDYIVYGTYYGVDLDMTYQSLAIKNAKEFDKIFFVRPDDTPIADDGFRFTDVNERNAIDQLFCAMILNDDIKCEEIKTEDIFLEGGK
jgi:nicotinamide riboside kinase